MSMAASAFLSARADGGSTDRHPGKTACYTGIAYVCTVIVLILPYLLLPNVKVALAVMLGSALGIIALFNFYLSVAKDTPFRRSFCEMAGISTFVAAASFAIGYVLTTRWASIDARVPKKESNFFRASGNIPLEKTRGNARGNMNDLVRRLKQGGDEKAVSLLVERYGPRLTHRRHASVRQSDRRAGPDDRDASESRARHRRVPGSSSFFSWLYGILFNLNRMAWRKRSRSRVVYTANCPRWRRTPLRSARGSTPRRPPTAWPTQSASSPNRFKRPFCSAITAR
jgi:hypothetical protein